MLLETKQQGVVSQFNVLKGYGFITSSDAGRVFFHENRYCKAVSSLDRYEPELRGANRIEGVVNPKPGDVIVFWLDRSNPPRPGKCPEAYQWTFATEWNRAMVAIQERAARIKLAQELQMPHESNWPQLVERINSWACDGGIDFNDQKKMYGIVDRYYQPGPA